ncbi:MAG: hypothetical protein ACHBN1_37225 [Heteroscytonema crispum UTEX LB 1556]
MSICNINNIFCLTALSSFAVVLATFPANALPGQNISAVVKWAKTRPQLPPVLKYNSEVSGYDGTKGNLYFYVNVTSEKGSVTKEGITVSGDRSIKFANDNAKGVKLLEDIYNAGIANDFRNARSVAKVGRDTFYRGQKFGYITAEVQGGTNFQMIALGSLQKAIDDAKYCQTHQCDL